MKLKQTLTTLTKQRGLSLARLAKEAGVSPKTLHAGVLVNVP